MGKPKKQTDLFTRMKTQYRIVFINDGSLKEVASYKLSLRRMYVFFSTVFVLIVALTVCVLLITPLKYYIPGYGGNTSGIKIMRMKRSMDSLSDLVNAQQQYEANIRHVINGDYNGKKDTTLLNLSEVRKDQMNVIPQPADMKKEAEQEMKAGHGHKTTMNTSGD